MADGVVTEEELNEQKERIITLLKKFEKGSTPEQIDQVRELLAEISVLVAANNLMRNK